MVTSLPGNGASWGFQGFGMFHFGRLLNFRSAAWFSWRPSRSIIGATTFLMFFFNALDIALGVLGKMILDRLSGKER